MDVDQGKSATTEDQMEAMMTLMMDKFPEVLYGSYNDVVDHPSPPLTFTNLATNPYFPDHPQANSIPPYLHQSPPSTNNALPLMSYNPNTQVQEPPLDFLEGSDIKKGSFSASASSMATMREMIFRIAAMQPIHIDPEAVKPPKRRNVKISKDPQSVAARHRRERISERIRILQRLVPGGTKMDTASMLDEAIHYVKFLKTQVQSLERAQVNGRMAASPCSSSSSSSGMGFPVAMSTGSYFPGLGRGPVQDVQDFRDA